MRIARLRPPGGKVVHGVVEGDEVTILDGTLFGRWKRTSRRVALKDAQLLTPLIPPNILALGRNYKAHAEEFGSDLPAAPQLFIKASTAINPPGAPIVLPRSAPTHVDYEAELAVVIGRRAKGVSEAEALDCVLGYTCANDVTARDCQRADGQWARAKSFDTFAPLGPWIETEFDPSAKRIVGRLNGEVMQDASTALLVFSVPFLISYLSRDMTLLPGTVILTGTPAGCGFARQPPVFLKAGDVYEVEIEGLGTLRNPVTDGASASGVVSTKP